MRTRYMVMRQDGQCIYEFRTADYSDGSTEPARLEDSLRDELLKMCDNLGLIPLRTDERPVSLGV